jgi:hypothetical protein
MRGLAASAAIAMTACASTPVEEPVEAAVVQVVGHDFALDAPDSLPAGPTRFHFRSDGTVPHEVAIARVKQGVPLDSVLRLELAGGDIDGLYDPGEGLLYTAVGETVDAELLVTLDAGRDYVLICTLEKDGKPHSTMGMVKGVRVR